MAGRVSGGEEGQTQSRTLSERPCTRSRFPRTPSRILAIRLGPEGKSLKEPSLEKLDGSREITQTLVTGGPTREAGPSVHSQPAPWPVGQPCGGFFLNTNRRQPRITRHLRKASQQNTEPKLGEGGGWTMR